MSPARLLAFAFVGGLALWVVFGQLRATEALGNGLHPRDAFSEANAIRAAQGYVDRGFLAHAGLPNITYGRQFPRFGEEREKPRGDSIYTHYPPGPIWILGAATAACGRGEVGCFRRVPLLVNGTAALVFALGLVALLGPLRGALAAPPLLLVPMFGNMMPGLYHQGYAASLLALQLLGIAHVLRAPSVGAVSDRPSSGALAGLFGLGFVQGWLSFDYFFLVSLAALPMAFLLSDLREPAARRRLLWLLAAPAAGFVIAHGLHFVQVVAWSGGVVPAVQDLLASAQERFDPGRARELRGAALSAAQTDPAMVASFFYFVLSPQPIFFGFSLGYLILAALALWLVAGGRSLTLPGLPFRALVREPSRCGWALVVAVGVSLLWIVTMRGHSVVHQHFIPRHLYLSYFVAVYALLVSVRFERAASSSPPAPADAA